MKKKKISISAITFKVYERDINENLHSNKQKNSIAWEMVERIKNMIEITR